VASYVTDALVTSTRRYGEADRLLILLTPDHGRVGAIAKSARKAKSRLNGATELFVHARIELAEGKSLAIVRQVEVIDPHLGIRESWARLQLAGHVAEIANKMGEENHPDKDLYEITVRAMAEIDQDRRDAVLRFKVALLDHMGVFPDVGGCADCGSGRVKGRVHLDGTRGGFLCDDCAKINGVYHPVSMQVLHLMHALRASAELAPDIDDETLDLTDDLLTNLLQGFIQVGFKTFPAARQARVNARDHGKVKAENQDSISEDEPEPPKD
jgi:DNA repair protein RecO (recombination protein O)